MRKKIPPALITNTFLTYNRYVYNKPNAQEAFSEELEAHVEKRDISHVLLLDVLYILKLQMFYLLPYCMNIWGRN